MLSSYAGALRQFFGDELSLPASLLQLLRRQLESQVANPITSAPTHLRRVARLADVYFSNFAAAQMATSSALMCSVASAGIYPEDSTKAAALAAQIDEIYQDCMLRRRQSELLKVLLSHLSLHEAFVRVFLLLDVPLTFCALSPMSQELREPSAPTAELLPLIAQMPALMSALSEAFRARIASLEEVLFSLA